MCVHAIHKQFDVIAPRPLDNPLLKVIFQFLTSHDAINEHSHFVFLLLG